MGYRHMEIHSLRSIIRRYLTVVGEYGIEQGKELPDDNRLQEILELVLPANRRTRSKRDQLQEHKNELITLITGKRRKTYAFVGKLSNSRYPFIEFCHTQDNRQFVESNVRMMEFFEGATQRIVFDNLKAGVLKPDLYDPVVNPAYQDFAEHYGTFIDTARVATPTDKAKVERPVQDARELFRYLVSVYPSYTLAQLNTEALKWCRYEYGERAHGTTGKKPAEAWKTEELPAMASLPPAPFEIPDYKWATVHPDRFYSYDKRRYAMPAAYRGEKVLLRCSGAVLRVFDSRYCLICEYVGAGQKINWLPGDFPEDRGALLKGSYPCHERRHETACTASPQPSPPPAPQVRPR